MPSFDFDIAIIGGGCIGSSILYELCHRGFRNVALIDYGRKTHSATAHSGGMIRVFHENPEHIALSLRNRHLMALYQHRRVLSDGLQVNGSLYFFNKNRYGDYRRHLVKMENAHYPFEVLTTADGHKHFPQYAWKDVWAIHEPTGGRFSPHIYTNDLLAESMRCGATLFDDFKVHRICTYLDRYKISGDQALLTTKKLVLAGGARLLPRLQDLSLSLPFEIKKMTTYVAKKTDNDFVIPNYFNRESLAFGCFSDKRDVILSHRHCTQVLQKQWGDRMEKRSADDIYAPGRLGLLGSVAGFPGLFIASGWGGTAFKFALEVGHRVVNAIELSMKSGESR